MMQPADAHIAEKLQLALEQYKRGEFRQAAKNCFIALKQYRDNAELNSFLGLILYSLKKPHFANRLLARANQLAPNNPLYLNNQATILFRQKKFDEAEAIYQHILTLQPNFKDAATNLANLYHLKKEPGKSLETLRKIAHYYPNDIKVNYALAKLYTISEQYRAAFDLLVNLVNLDPNLEQIHLYAGVAAYNLNLFHEAILYLKEFIDRNPNDYQGWIYYGVALTKRKKRNLLEEIACYKKAIAIDPQNTAGYFHIAKTIIKAGHYPVPLKILKWIMEKEPESMDAYVSYGLIELACLNIDESIRINQFILEKNPDAVVARTNLSLAYLLQGDFEKGWPEYEARWKHEDLADLKKNFSGQRWQGEPLDNKTLMVFTEQGFGDVIQFVRYIPLINKGSGKIIIECRDALIPLIKTVPNLDFVVPRVTPFPAYDYYIPLLSLPGLFKTDINTIPHNLPYLFVDPTHRKKWRILLAPYAKHFKIGIAWAGSPSHADARRRSMPEKYFKQLQLNDNIKIFAVQKDTDDVACQRYGFINLDQSLQNFADSAACIEQLDLIISVDTSLVHLAGALNKPTWVLLPFKPDWRWLLGRTDSPWYPSARLIRQKKRGDWQGVIKECHNLLKHLLNL